MSRNKREQGPFKRHTVSARTPNQKNYIHGIVENHITCCLGPPGTGKTHIAAGMAVQMMRREEIDRIIVCRPVVDVGKGIGWLPGTVEEKVGPYLVPLFDELSYFIDIRYIRKFMTERIIEIVPLSMMRGRTFNDSFVILDEAQNATHEELKTLLTRIGQNSKMVLAGDPGQSDLPQQQQGDFARISCKLHDLDGVCMVQLTRDDIVRHELIAAIEDRLGDD